jgi:hypothetical protein
MKVCVHAQCWTADIEKQVVRLNLPGEQVWVGLIPDAHALMTPFSALRSNFRSAKLFLR